MCDPSETLGNHFDLRKSVLPSSVTEFSSIHALIRRSEVEIPCGVFCHAGQFAKKGREVGFDPPARALAAGHSTLLSGAERVGKRLLRKNARRCFVLNKQQPPTAAKSTVNVNRRFMVFTFFCERSAVWSFMTKPHSGCFQHCTLQRTQGRGVTGNSGHNHSAEHARR